MPATPKGVAGAVITGWGTALPPKVLTNDDLAGTMDTTDEWIRERTGIRERRVGGTTAGLSVESGEKAMAHAGVTADDIALVVPHQANIRIIEAACQRLGIPMERATTVLHYTGNTSSASIPLALVDALDDGRANKGDLLLLVGFGAGMTAASAVLRWGGVPA